MGFRMQFSESQHARHFGELSGTSETKREASGEVDVCSKLDLISRFRT
jgi:hypothetical protein